jgi:hypothetical protein
MVLNNDHYSEEHAWITEMIVYSNLFATGVQRCDFSRLIALSALLLEPHQKALSTNLQ